jgi:hypothetical protein
MTQGVKSITNDNFCNKKIHTIVHYIHDLRDVMQDTLLVCKLKVWCHTLLVYPPLYPAPRILTYSILQKFYFILHLPISVREVKQSKSSAVKFFYKFYKCKELFLLQGMTAAPSLSAAEARRSRCGAAWTRGAWPPS